MANQKLTDKEKHELSMLEAIRKTGLSLSQAGRYDWLKWGKINTPVKEEKAS